MGAMFALSSVPVSHVNKSVHRACHTRKEMVKGAVQNGKHWAAPTVDQAAHAVLGGHRLVHLVLEELIDRIRRGGGGLHLGRRRHCEA